MLHSCFARWAGVGSDNRMHDTLPDKANPLVGTICSVVIYGSEKIPGWGPPPHACLPSVIGGPGGCLGFIRLLRWLGH